VKAFVRDFLRRACKRAPQEKIITISDHAPDGRFEVQREPGEDAPHYAERVALYREFLGRTVDTPGA
jgi:hypothetical protein